MINTQVTPVCSYRVDNPQALNPQDTAFSRLSQKYSLERSIRALQRDIKYFKYTETITLSASYRFRIAKRLEAQLREKETLLKELLING